MLSAMEGDRRFTNLSSQIALSGRSNFMNSLMLGPLIEDETNDGFTKKLLSNRRNELKAFAIAIRNENFLSFISTSQGESAFSDLIDLGVNSYGVSQKALATATGASPATVSRWAKGSSLPPIYARKAIAEAMAMMIEHDLDI